VSIIIYKTTPGADCYVLWRTNNDAPVFIGGRVEAAARLKAEAGFPGVVAAKLDVADRTGTSNLDGTGGWGDEGFTVGEDLFPRGVGFRFLPRPNLEQFVRAAVKGDVRRMLALTEEMTESACGPGR
jgi:hypothetical protein